MRPRRSRFTRIYRKLARRGPNRHAQWQQIVTLRPHGSPGYPVSAPRMRAIASNEWAPEPDDQRRGWDEPEISWREAEYIQLQRESLQETEPAQRSGGPALAALTAALFLLACAYAAFAGYTHAYNDNYSVLGVLGAIGSLGAAAVGICMSAWGLRPRLSGRFLALGAAVLAGTYGVLLFLASGR